MVRWLISLATIALLTAPLAQAQRRPAVPIARTLTLDVIGPRSPASVRSWLTGNVRSLAACRGAEEALVVVALAIGSDGTLVSVEPGEDPSSDATATACVVTEMRAWRMPRRVPSVTTVSWGLRLGAAPLVECHCFNWVHGLDHGISCSTTAAGCEAEAHASMRDHTPCRRVMALRCSDEAIIDGARMERP